MNCGKVGRCQDNGFYFCLNLVVFDDIPLCMLKNIERGNSEGILRDLSTVVSSKIFLTLGLLSVCGLSYVALDLSRKFQNEICVQAGINNPLDDERTAICEKIDILFTSFPQLRD